MSSKRLFLFAGGGTGGHVIPAIAVAREITRMGHEALFVGTERGVESRLVPQAGFRLELIRVGGLKGLGVATKIVSLWQLLKEAMEQVVQFGHWEPSAVFSMGGYVAGPPVIAALLRQLPLVVMEPNAVPGFTNRMVGRFVTKALISFEETRRFFPREATELTGLPVREEFFGLPQKEERDAFTVLVTGGSQGSRTLNQTARESWPMFGSSGLPIRFIHQSGRSMESELASAMRSTGVNGTVTAFINDMPAAFAEADLIVCRSGAGAVSELAAAGKPSVLIPFPFATDDHQLKNAEAFERAGAARLCLDREWNPGRFFETVRDLYGNRAELKAMGLAARKLAHPGAAKRAAEILSSLSD